MVPKLLLIFSAASQSEIWVAATLLANAFGEMIEFLWTAQHLFKWKVLFSEKQKWSLRFALEVAYKILLDYNSIQFIFLSS